MPNNYKIPVDLDEALEELLKEFSPEQLEEFNSNDPLLYHRGLGTFMRNHWGLWHGWPLAQWFDGKGIYHADDMSSIILTSLHRKLNGEKIDLEGQISYYQEYWKKINNTLDRGIL